ncbi:hypothetical protein BGW39_003643 [Mortierella sp. 14UC]|nr:hypothetical protein BGW39_003643 [Mortierella sp. 14UC]
MTEHDNEYMTQGTESSGSSSSFPLSGATLVPSSMSSSAPATSQPTRKSRLIMDSDDEMEDDGAIRPEEEDMLNLPMGYQSLDMNFGQDFVATGPSTIDNCNQDRIHVNPVDLGSRAPTQGESRPSTSTRDEDDLFGDDFFAQFGADGELEFQEGLNKKPLFSRRIPLLEATDESNDGPDNEDLGLEKLSISQSHRTKSGAPPVTETTRSTHTASSSTTITSSIPSRLNSFGRSSSSTEHLSSKSHGRSQHEDELYEMAARQEDAMLDDLIRQDEMLRDEGAGLQELLEAQFHEQELSMRQTSDTNKRKGPGINPATTAASAESSDIAETIAEYDRFLAESALIGNSGLENAIEASKRSRLQPPPERSGRSGLSTKAKAPEVKKYDYTLPPATGSFIKAKSSSGESFYLPKKVRTNEAKNSFMQQLLPNEKGSSLLTVPIHRMMDEMEMEIRNQKEEALLLLEDDDVMGLEDDPTSGPNERLWVDKYRPKKYTDLMGDERVNREVLSWIKEWDQCVFGRKYHKFTPEHKKQQFKEFRKPDALGRPDRKVLLLTGPPGLGKTTMAHVIARQAGYNVVEVNASDDRTGASIKGKIEAALEIQSILGSDKPNMLVIDEIDGVSSSGGEQSFIKLLVDIATVEVASKEETSKAGGGGRKNNKKFTKKPLMRPIICICNDQYAPVLRPLRTIAQIYQFKKPSVRTVVNRLQQICEIEQVPSDTRAFGVLYEMTEGDMRSCLNTLQFIKNKSRTSPRIAADATQSSPYKSGASSGSSGDGLTVEALTKSTIGRKDQNKTLFSVWEEIFQATYARKTRSALKVMEEGREGLVKDDNNTYVSRMVGIVQNNGDYDKLMQGCFENYPTMIFHDVAMSKVVEMTEWLAFYDQLNYRVSSNFEYEVGGYMAYALASFHRFFAGSVRQKIEYPRKDYESFVAHKANESILQGMALNLPAKVQRHFRKSNFATELLSPFLRILSPFLRPVNKQLIKPDERAVLMRLVDIMIHFQLTFIQEKTEDGQFLYRLEPSIEKLGDFSTIGLKNVLTNRYAVRQLIAQEIEMELVRRTEAAKEAKMGAFFGKTGQNASMLTGVSASVLPMEPELSLKEATDFFGRAIVVPDSSHAGAGGTLSLDMMDRPKKKTRIWYKFNEGFSNAVKAKAISHVNLYFMTPCLLFTKIASTITWEQFLAFWPIPVFFLLFSAVSWTLAKYGSRFLRFNRDEEKFVIASVLFSNTNSLPMALVQSLALSAAGAQLLRDEHDTQEQAAARGISYILFYAIFGNLVRWSYGFTLLVPKDPEPSLAPSIDSPLSVQASPPPELENVLVDADEPSGSGPANRVIDTAPSSPRTLYGEHNDNYADYMGDDDDHSDSQDPRTRRNSAASLFSITKKAKRNQHSTNLQPISPPTQSPRGLSLGFPSRRQNRKHVKGSTRKMLRQKATTALERIRQVLTPPLFTALLALVIGLVPALHQLIMGADSKFYAYVIRPIEGCGAAAIPMILLCLGAQVVHLASTNAATPDPRRPAPPQRRRSSNIPSVFPHAHSISDSSSSEDDEQEDPGWLRIPNQGSRKAHTQGRGQTTLSHASSSTTLYQQHNDQASDDELPTPGQLLPSSDNGLTETGLYLRGHRYKKITPVAFTLLARMVLAPLICLPAILFHPSNMSPILTMDPMFTLTLMLLAAAPTAINMTQLCQIKGFFETEMAQVLFWSYCVLGIPCVLGWSLVGLWAAAR